MTAASPAPERRRSRPGSLERPVNSRLYRGTWLLVGLPLLLLAFSVARPPALNPPNLPPAFDASQAASIAKDLASNYPDRRPGTLDARGAAAWFRRQLEPYGFDVHTDPFTATQKFADVTLDGDTVRPMPRALEKPSSPAMSMPIDRLAGTFIGSGRRDATSRVPRASMAGSQMPWGLWSSSW